MKTLLTSLAIFALAIILLPACKKDNDSEPQTTLQKIQGTWILEKAVYNDYYSSSNHIRTTIGTPADLFDFRTDGKVYSSVGGIRDTTTYSVVNDTKIVIDGTNNFDIKTLNSNSFIVYSKELFGPTDFEEVTITWKK